MREKEKLPEKNSTPEDESNDSTSKPEWEAEWRTMRNEEALQCHEENMKSWGAYVKEMKSRDKTQFKRS